MKLEGGYVTDIALGLPISGNGSPQWHADLVIADGAKVELHLDAAAHEEFARMLVDARVANERLTITIEPES